MKKAVIFLMILATAATITIYSIGDRSEEGELFQETLKTNTETGYLSFMAKYPDSRYSKKNNGLYNKSFAVNEEKAKQGSRIFFANCSICHQLEGNAITYKMAPPLTHAASKLSEKWMANWLHQPQLYSPRFRMPKFNLNKEQAKAITAYILANSSTDYGNKKNIKTQEELVQEGKKVYEASNCKYCHIVEGKGTFSGPDLDKVATKTNPDWLYNWMKDPASYHPYTFMPSGDYNEQEIMAMVSWMNTLKWKDMPLIDVDITNKKMQEQGKSLIEKNGCAYCHSINGISKDTTLPIPGNFIKNGYKHNNDPASIAKIITEGIPETSMPGWKEVLSPGQINLLVHYLKSLEK